MSQQKIYSILTQLQKQKQYFKFYNITWRQGRILSSIVSLYEPSSILEVGTSNGFSTLWMLYGFPDSNITTIEINPNLVQKAKINFSQCDNKISIINEDIYKVSFSSKYNMIFIDALQQEYEQLIEYLLSKNILEGSHFFIIDNILSHNKKKHLESLFELKGYNCTIIEEGSGFLIATYQM